jgi:hypothetical protein
MANEHCLDHDKYLAKVSYEVVRKRLEVFHLKSTAIEVLPFVCRSFQIAAPFTEFREWMKPVDPENLYDLKNWFGVPNETAQRMLSQTRSSSVDAKWCHAPDEPPRALPMMRDYEFGSLDPEQQVAVRETANNLLYGYADPEKIQQPPWSGVINYMLKESEGLKIFVAPDLIVCPDNVIKFKNIPALFFNNILIYGNGRIITESKTKVHAFQIRHVDV